jgi:hypothetical protein
MSITTQGLSIESEAIIKTTLQILSEFKDRVEEVPGALDLVRRYEDDLRSSGDADDERRLLGVADDILGIIGGHYDNSPYAHLKVEVICDLQRRIKETVSARRAS